MSLPLLLSSLAWAFVAWATWRMWARIPVLRRVAADVEGWPSGGMYWRGTFYPLAALREGALMESDYPTDRVR